MGYWETRQEAMYKAGEMQVNQYFERLEKAFNQTRRELQKTIEAFYFEYAEENGLSYAAAQRQLSKAEIGNLRDFIDLAMENIGKHNQTVNNMSIKARITRYEALEAQVDAMLRQLYAVDYQAAAEQTMKAVYEDTFFQTWYNIDLYRGFHSEFAQVNPRAVEKLLEYPFNGANFSSRLWKQKDHLQSQLMEALTTMMVQGKSPHDLTNDFAKKMNVKKFDAYRLLHTESSFLMSQATHAGYKEDGVEKYQILATLDSKTCDICGDLDGEVYDVGKEIAGVNMPPFHCFCRCTDVPYDDDDDLSGEKRVARDPETGKAVEVPANMTYKEWKQKFAVEKGIKSDKMEVDHTRKYQSVEEEHYDKLIENHRQNVTEEERSSTMGFDWDNFRPMNEEYGYINTMNSEVINRAIRDNSVDSLPSQSKKTIEDLKNIISKNTIDDNLIVHRHVTEAWFVDKFGAVADKEAAVRKMIDEGSIITDNQFVSGSLTDEDSYADREIKVIFQVPSGCHGYVTENRMESEVIFDRPSYKPKMVETVDLPNGKKQLVITCEMEIDNE